MNYFFTMYPLLTPEELTEMRRDNEKRLNINKNITFQRKRSIEEKKPFTFEKPLDDLCADLFTDGCIVPHRHGLVMTHSQMPFYYRGQTKDHGNCYSSLFRKINKNNYSSDEKTREIFLNQLRISELSLYQKLQKCFKTQKMTYKCLFSLKITFRAFKKHYSTNY